MTDYKAWLRRRMLEDIYDRMSDDEKKLFVQLTMQDKSNEQILSALRQQQTQLETIKRSQNWAVDFGSDVAANLLTDGLILIGRKLFGKI